LSEYNFVGVENVYWSLTWKYIALGTGQAVLFEIDDLTPQHSLEIVLRVEEKKANGLLHMNICITI
jgi:hypothetical protein